MSYDDIPGWFDWQDIYTEAVETAPKDTAIVEIGVAFGRSFAFLQETCNRLGRDDLWLYGIDPFVDDWSTEPHDPEHTRPSWGANHAEWARSTFSNAEQACRESLAQHSPLRPRSILVANYSWDAHDAVQHPIWCVFVDGNHNYEPVKRDLHGWGARILPGGILAGHDYTYEFPGVVRAVHEYFQELLPARGTSFFKRIT